MVVRLITAVIFLALAVNVQASRLHDAIITEVESEAYRTVSAQYPLPTDGDTTYPKDLLESESDIGSFTGDIYDLLGDSNFTTTLTATGPTNPKYVELRFKRPILMSGMGIATQSGSFSNTKISIELLDGSTATIFDESADPTLKTFLRVGTEPVNFVKLRVEFHTANDVSVSGIVAAKDRNTVARIQGQSETTGLIENVKTFNGALNVTDGLVHKSPINFYFERDLGGSTTPSVAITSGDKTVTFTSTAGFAVNDLVRIEEGAFYEMVPLKITNIAGALVTFNRAIDNDYTTAAAINEIDINMNDDGSVTPISYMIEPPPGQIWQITRIIIGMLDSTQMDDGLFGGLTALPNGTELRSVKNGFTRTATVWNTNSDIASDMFNVEYSSKAPAGQYGLRGRWTFTNLGVVIELDGDNGDFAEILNSDDLTGLDEFTIKAQGRIFGE